jgi:hypothetical protein
MSRALFALFFEGLQMALQTDYLPNLEDYLWGYVKTRRPDTRGAATAPKIYA